jgi:hypothetical protein
MPKEGLVPVRRPVVIPPGKIPGTPAGRKK